MDGLRLLREELLYGYEQEGQSLTVVAAHRWAYYKLINVKMWVP